MPPLPAATIIAKQTYLLHHPSILLGIADVPILAMTGMAQGRVLSSSVQRFKGVIVSNHGLSQASTGL